MKRFLLLVILLGSICSGLAQSPNVHVIVSGLLGPRGLKFGPDGNIYVAEAGLGGDMSTQGQCDQPPAPVGPYKGGFTSRISKVTLGGARTTVADKLPSHIDAINDFGGIADVAFVGDKLYALSTGAGCSHGHANEPNALLQVNSDGTTTIVADLSAFLKAHPVAHPPSDYEADGQWYSMLPARGALAVVEANSGQLDLITTSGQVTRIADLSADPWFGPTAIAYDGDFYVGNLSTFPIMDGSSKVLKITPDGQVSTFATGFTTILGLAFDSLHRLYVLETTTGGNQLPTPGTGKVVRINADASTEEIATGLSLPTAMTFGPDGNLYVSNWGFGPPDKGEIVRVNLAPSAAGHFGNISTRAFVESGEHSEIGGFILEGGSELSSVIVRALGPSLADKGVAAPLPDPTLDLRDKNGTQVAFNDNWKDDSDQASQISAANLAPTKDSESAIYATLPSGEYTAIVADKNGKSGTALVEIYNLTD